MTIAQNSKRFYFQKFHFSEHFFLILSYRSDEWRPKTKLNLSLIPLIPLNRCRMSLMIFIFVLFHSGR